VDAGQEPLFFAGSAEFSHSTPFRNQCNFFEDSDSSLEVGLLSDHDRLIYNGPKHLNVKKPDFLVAKTGQACLIVEDKVKNKIQAVEQLLAYYQDLTWQDGNPNVRAIAIVLKEKGMETTAFYLTHEGQKNFDFDIDVDLDNIRDLHPQLTWLDILDPGIITFLEDISYPDASNIS
jgi:hypothetical protein